MKKGFGSWKIVLFFPVIIAFVQFYPIRFQNKPKNSSGRNYISEIIQLNKIGENWINVDRSKWPDKEIFENQVLQVSLIFEEPDKVSESDYLNTPLSFILYSQNNSFNRLVYNNDFDTNKVVLKDLSVFTYNGYARQYKIGLINNFRDEDIHIKLNLVNSDSLISGAKPRILIEPYERAQISHPVVSFLDQILFVIAFLCLLLIILNEVIIFILKVKKR